MNSNAAQFEEIKLLEEKLSTGSIPPELQKKAKALASAVMEMDRKHITDLIKGLLGNIRKKSAVKKPAKKRKRKSTR